MRKLLKHLPLMLCALHGFYPLMQLLGWWLKFGYELRSSLLSAALTALISVAAAILLIKAKPAYGFAGRAALVLALPLSCLNAFFMVPVIDSMLTPGLCALSCIACSAVFLSLNFRKWYTRALALIAILPMLALTWLFLMASSIFLDFGSTQLLRSYETGDSIRYDYYVDEGALGEGWYTDVYAKDSVPLLFGTFHPHYERIRSDSPL